MIRHPPISPLFPYPTLFRSPRRALDDAVDDAVEGAVAPAPYLHPCRAPLALVAEPPAQATTPRGDRKSTRLNSSHPSISYAVFCLKKKKTKNRSICTTADCR